MIVMDLKIDNFFAFNNFHINMSYPKKIVLSGLTQSIYRIDQTLDTKK